MADRPISDWGALPLPTTTGDLLIVQRGSDGYKLDRSNLNTVDLTGNQTIAGTKTFSTAPLITGSGFVQTTGTQSIGGNKTFTSGTVSFDNESSASTSQTRGVTTAGTACQHILFGARGTLTSPAAFQTGDNNRVDARFYDGSAYQSVARLVFTATETHSGSARGTNVTLQGTPATTTTLTTLLKVNDVGIYNDTTATAANVVITSANVLQRSTSSKKFKTEIEDMDIDLARKIVDSIRPIWYRSLCATDNKDWSWWGVLAEELAEIDPRLVTWGYWPEDYEAVETKLPDGSTENRAELKKDAKLSPVGVQYDRISVLMLKVMQADRERLDSMEARLAKLEAKK